MARRVPLEEKIWTIYNPGKDGRTNDLTKDELTPDRYLRYDENNCRRETVAMAPAGSRVLCGWGAVWIRSGNQHHPHVASTAAAVPQMPRFRFENYNHRQRPSRYHVYAVLVDGARIWRARTMAWVYTKTEMETYSTKDGLAHRAVLCWLWTTHGDVWGGTMGGLSRISGGRSSLYAVELGLSNNVVYGVSVEGENVWVATAPALAAQSAHRRVVAL